MLTIEDQFYGQINSMFPVAYMVRSKKFLRQLAHTDLARAQNA